MEGAPGRIRTLDLIRGVAVLGILAVNITGFAGPIGATRSPHIPAPGSAVDEAAFALMLLVFEGKMRMLFCMLFGASLVLFVDRTDAQGRGGDALQLRRLGWLALFGMAHYLLLWWGDILFAYAAIGLVVLALHRRPLLHLGVLALMVFSVWTLTALAATVGDAAAAEQLHRGTATAAQMSDHAAALADSLKNAAADLGMMHASYSQQFAHRLVEHPLWLPNMALNNLWELLPLMLIGVIFQRSGFFAGEWPRPLVLRMVRSGILGGGLLSLAVIGWAWWRHFDPVHVGEVVAVWSAAPHLLMATGYAAALVLLAPRLLHTRLGRRIEATGRMAFSNYLGTTVVMTAMFSGWGLNLAGTVPESRMGWFVLLGWTLMLGWSQPWLRRFRQGPLEWAWRCLTEWRRLPLRRADQSRL